MKYKLNVVLTRINIIYFISLCFGSSLYLGLPTFSLMNLLLPLSLIINIYSLSNGISKSIWYSLSLYLFFIIGIVFPFLLLQASEDQVKDFIYLVHFLNIILLSANFSKNQLKYVRVIKYIFWIWVILAILQFAFIIGILPASFEFLFYQKTDSVSFYQVNGIFANSNDFSCIIFLFYFMIVYYNEKLFKLYSLITAVVLLLSLSRSAILLFIIFLIYRKAIVENNLSKILKRSVCILVLLGFVLFSKIDFIEYDNPNFEFVTRNVNRLISIINIVQGGVESDNSSSIRIDSYLYAAKKLPSHLIGTGAKNYASFYNNNMVDLGVLEENPHSFIIEIGISYGIFAVIIFNLLFGYLLFSKKNNLTLVEKKMFIFLLFTTLLFSNIPSSVIRLPVLWMPVFFLFVSNSQYEKERYNEI